MTIRGVSLDLFHTLVHVGDVAEGRPMTYEMLGLTREAFHASWIKRMFPMCRGEGPIMLEAYRQVCRENGLDRSDAELREIMAERLRRFRRALLEPRPEIVRAVHDIRARGLRVGLFSNAIREDITAWDESPLKPCFDAVVFSCHEGTMKPEAAFYRRGLERLGVGAGEALHAGDGGQGELAGARDAGYAAVVYVNEYRAVLDPASVEEIRAHADWAIESVTELPALLEQLETRGSRRGEGKA